MQGTGTGERREVDGKRDKDTVAKYITMSWIFFFLFYLM